MRRAQAEVAADWLHAGIDACVCPGDSAAERLVRSGGFGKAGRRTDGRPPRGAGAVRAVGDPGRILRGSWPDPSGKLAGSFGDGSRTVRGPPGGERAVSPGRRPRRWRGAVRWASAPGGCPGRRTGPQRSAGTWNQSLCTDLGRNLSWAFTRARPGRAPRYRRCKRTLTDSGLRALIVNFDPTIAKIDTRQGGGPRHPFPGLSPAARHDRLRRALPHVTDGIPQPALRGPFLKGERKAKRHGAVALHATQAGDLRRKANAIKKIEPPRLLVAHAAQPLAPRENVSGRAGRADRTAGGGDTAAAGVRSDRRACASRPERPHGSPQGPLGRKTTTG